MCKSRIRFRTVLQCYMQHKRSEYRVLISIPVHMYVFSTFKCALKFSQVLNFVMFETTSSSLNFICFWKRATNRKMIGHIFSASQFLVDFMPQTCKIKTKLSNWYLYYFMLYHSASIHFNLISYYFVLLDFLLKKKRISVYFRRFVKVFTLQIGKNGFHSI